MAAQTPSSLLNLVAWVGLSVALVGDVTAQAPKPATPPPAGPIKATSIAALNRMLKEADAAFDAKEYAAAVTKTEELLKALGPKPAVPDEMMERLYYNIALCSLLGGKPMEAEKAFTECVSKFPKGLFATRCALGVGKACIDQDTPAKKEQAIKVLKVAMLDPKLNAEAGLMLAQLYSELGKRNEALVVFKALMGADIRTPGQTAAAVGVINLLADEGKLDDLVYYLDRLTNQAGVRDAIAWYTNQVIVRGDESMTAQDFDTALAIYQTVPSRNQILETQALALEIQRKNLALLEKTVAKEMEAEKLNPGAPRSVAREMIAYLAPAIEANDKALAVIREKKDLDASLLMRRGRCFYHLNRFEEARICFSTLRLKYPSFKENKVAAYAEIQIMDKLKKSAGLLELCKAYLAAYPDSEDAEPIATLAGELLVQEKKWTEVATYYKELESKFPNSPNLDRFIFYQGLSHFLDADFDLSNPLMEKLTRTFPKSQLYESGLYYLAMANFMSNDYKKAVASCTEYLTKYPTGLYAGDMRYRLSFIDSNDPRVPPEKIIEDLEKFIADHPQDVSNGSMLCLLGDTYKKKGDDDAAVGAFKKAVWSKYPDGSSSPDDVIQYALDNATTIMQTKKDWDGIAELHGAFLKEYPKSQLALLSAGQVVKMKVRQGKGEEGAAILAESLRTRIGDPAVEQVEYLLDLLVETLVPRKRPAKEVIEAIGEELDKKVVEVLTKIIGEKPSPTATARLFYTQARLSQLLYRTSRTDRSDLLLKAIATNYAGDPAALSPTLLSVCGDILLKENNLDGAEAMFKRLNDSYKDSLFSDAGPLGLGNVALARKQPDKALAIFDDILVNNKGTSRFKETMVGKLQALIDLGEFEPARKLAQDIVGDKMFRGELAGKAYLMLADSYRVEAAKEIPGSDPPELLRKAHATYQRIYLAYQSQPEICAEAYWQAYETAKTLNEYGLASETLRLLMNNPKLQNTQRAKDAKDKAL